MKTSIKQKKTAIFAFLLAAATVAGTMTACADSAKDGAKDGTDTGAVKTNPAQTEETADINDPYSDRMNISANLPDGLDFGGAHLRSMVNDTNAGVMTNDIYTEAQTGDVVDDALYDRRVYVEELLNVVIDPSVIMPPDDASPAMRRSVNAGEDAYDVFLQHMIIGGGDVLEGIFLNWYDIPHMNFKNPWYPQTTIESLTIDNVMYTLMSDVMISSIHNTYCYFYNKDIAANNDLPDLYDIVSSGDWTFDQLTKLTKDIYKDLNGNGVQDMDDQYGYATSIDSNVAVYLWSFDVDMVTPSSNGVEITANNERMVNTVEKLRDFFYNSGETFVADVWTDFINMFVAEKVLFIPRNIGETQTFFREMDNYGLLPFPKYDTAQEQYYTMLDGCAPLMSIPKTARNTEMIGAVLEAMGEYSYKYVVPAYYDVALKVKGTRDEKSIEMLDIITAGRVVDFGFVFDNWKGFSFCLSELLAKNNHADFSSYYAKREKSVIKHYTQVYETFLEGNET
ncbi:MAG: hypothetical protein J6I50_06345 [Clostridia bacterium]|nr:hypothetical protein [Clostridia bacterium]